MRKLYLMVLGSLISLMAMSQTVSIGTGTDSSGPSPWNSYYGYSYVQTIYLQPQIAFAGNITSISYYFAGSSLDKSDDITIYMGNTAKASFANTNDWEPAANMTEVFSGTLANYSVPGWITIDLATPFAYNNTDNLVVAVDENKSDYNSSVRFNSTVVPGSNRVLQFSNDNTDPDPSSPPAGTRSSIVGNIILYFNGLGCQPVSGPTISGLTVDGAMASWTLPVTPPSQYNWELRLSGAPGSGAAGQVASGSTNSDTVSFTSLTASTTYSFYVRANCGTDSSVWSAPVKFTTLCGLVTDFSENFDGVTDPDFPSCWQKVGNDGSAYTQNIDAYSQPNALYIYSGSSTDQAVVSLPAVSNLGDGTHRLKFKARANFTQGGVVEVGYLTDPTDAASFTPLETITANSFDYEEFTIIPGALPGIEVLAFRHTGDPSNSVLIDNVTWEEIPQCDVPVDIIASAISTTGAQIDWSPPAASSPAAYDIYYSTSNTTPDSTTVPITSGIASTTTTLTGLNIETKYFVWVRSDCGSGGKSLWSAVDSFSTLCSETNVPYAQNFESVTTPDVPECTSIENAGLGNDWETVDNPGSDFNDKTLAYHYNSNNNADAWFYTQGLNLTAGTSYKLSFKYGNNSSSYTESLEVKFGSAPSSGAMTDPIIDLPSISLDGSAIASENFTPSATGIYYIGFHAYSIPDQFDLYLDDISVVVTPACEVPSAIVASNITTTTAQVDWTAPTIGIPADYQVYYSTSNITPSDSTAALDTTLTTTINITGLNPSSDYYLWVRSDCGSSISAWSPPIHFTTLCAAVESFTENFDGVTVPAFPTCWSKVGAGGSASVQDFDASSDPNTLYIYSSSTSDLAVVAMPPVSNLADGTHRLTFNARANFTEGGVVEIGYLTDPMDADSFVPIESFTASSTTYAPFTITPGPITGAEVLAFRHTGDPSNSVLIDDVSWELIPSCDIPADLVISNVTTSEAELDFTPPSVGSPVSYDVYVSTNDTIPTAATVPTMQDVVGTTVFLDSLSASTEYYVYVRSNCGNGDYSKWTTAVQFTTECGVIIPPTAIDPFNGDVPSFCWSQARGLLADPVDFSSTTISSWGSDDFGNVQGPFGTAARLNIYGTTKNDWLISPSYDLGTGGNFQLEFDLGLTHYADTASSTLGSDDKFAVLISTDDGASWSDANILQLWDASSVITNTGDHIIIDLSAYTGVVKFAFYGESTEINEDNDVFVDNFAVKQSGALPVKIVKFGGRREGAQNVLTWTTQNEQNNQGFELQRSTDGITFSALSFIASKAVGGNSNAAIQYVFADSRPFTGNEYYRLKQVDKDGHITMSNIVLINGPKINSIVLSNIYPNPAKNLLNISVASPANDKISFVITDLAGKMCIQQPEQLMPGENKFSVPVSKLLPGAYIIKAFCANGCEAVVGRFIKQ